MNTLPFIHRYLYNTSTFGNTFSFHGMNRCIFFGVRKVTFFFKSHQHITCLWSITSILCETFSLFISGLNQFEMFHKS